jgi:mRNA-degrading endonuclease RelE of RelBE toxin-antitoxin system
LSGYNDGLTEALGAYFEELQTVGDKAVEAIKEQIDEETDGVERDLMDNTPEATGGLKASLKRTTVTKGNRYDYRLEYEGNAPDGTPYAKIANILNNGTSTIKPRRFLTRAVRKLKGLDDRAAKRFENKLKT